MLTSPGDGWRKFHPPPLPVVQPAFHFLSSLLEQPVQVPLAKEGKKMRPPMSSALNGSLEKLKYLPWEILDSIVELVTAVDLQSGADLAVSCTFFNQLTTRHLYKRIELDTHDKVFLLARTIEETPTLGQHVQHLSLLCHRPQWAQMHKLATAMDMHAKGVSSLRVRFQSSDLHTAMPFLSRFSPETFEWVSGLVNNQYNRSALSSDLSVS
jgi:hypothetical protein